MMVAMTWPQYRRRQCSLDGRVIRLRGQEAEILLMLLLSNPDGFLPRDQLIEAMWPDPDFEPESAPISYFHVYMTRLRRLGVVIENRYRNHGPQDYGGWRIPREARGSELVRLAA